MTAKLIDERYESSVSRRAAAGLVALLAAGLPVTRARAQAVDSVAIKTYSQNFLTAVNGGGVGSAMAALTTNATTVGPNETFVVQWQNAAHTVFALRTADGRYVTAVNGGGVGGANDSTAPMHTDAKNLGPWEMYTMRIAPNNQASLQTYDGHYVSAQGGGDVSGQVIETTATNAASWETFHLVPDAASPLYTSVSVDIETGNDNARNNSEIVGFLTTGGVTTPFCIKPSNSGTDALGPNNTAICPQSSSAPSFGNFSSSTARVAIGPLLEHQLFGTLKIQLIQHYSGADTADNWDIQAVSVTANLFRASALTARSLLNLTNGNSSGDTCINRLKQGQGIDTVTYGLVLDSAATFPGIDCPQ